MEIINCEEKEMVPLTLEQNNFYNKQEICYICRKGFAWIKLIKII